MLFLVDERGIGVMGYAGCMNDDILDILEGFLGYLFTVGLDWE
jgi:hypothetical protein